MEERFSRTALLLGEAGLTVLAKARVAIFGLGGVGGYAVEALARAGIGTFLLVDGDTVSESNINRQLIATTHTVGQCKAALEQARILAINPQAQVTAKQLFFLPGQQDEVDFSRFDYVLDAIDTVAGKLAIIEGARAAGVPVITAMGAGNKRDPSAFRVADIAQTKGCPLARVMRRELKRRGITQGVQVVFSEEAPMTPDPALAITKGPQRRPTPGSLPYVPAAAGLLMAHAVVEDLLAKAEKKDVQTPLAQMD